MPLAARQLDASPATPPTPPPPFVGSKDVNSQGDNQPSSRASARYLGRCALAGVNTRSFRGLRHAPILGTMGAPAAGYRYLSQDVLNGFSKYVYRSVDDSPLSIYVMKPFWNWLVDVNILPTIQTRLQYPFFPLTYDVQLPELRCLWPWSRTDGAAPHQKRPPKSETVSYYVTLAGLPTCHPSPSLLISSPWHAHYTECYSTMDGAQCPDTCWLAVPSHLLSTSLVSSHYLQACHINVNRSTSVGNLSCNRPLLAVVCCSVP